MQLFRAVILLSPVIISAASLVCGSLLEKRNPVTSSDVELILAEHNNHRSHHGASPLKWDDKLASYANSWSNKCIVNHSASSYGENIVGRSQNWKQSIDAWYNEQQQYDYSHPGFNTKTGHFTQIIWQNTKSVGCAMSYCDNIKGNLFVCEYEPRGNAIYGGGDPAFYYKTNVTAPN